jgi:hypothetical protein
MTWHADAITIDRYTNATIDDASAFSLEAHLMVCAQCRQALGAAVGDAPRMEHIWADVVDQVDRPRATLAERALARIGVPAHLARLFVVAMRPPASAILAGAVLLGLPILSARGLSRDVLPFLVVVPIVTVWWIALQSALDHDPVDDIGLASPTGGFRLVMIRAIAAMLAPMALAGVAALLLPAGGRLAAAWVLPSFALGALTLAVWTVVGSSRAAAAIVSAAWLASVATIDRIAAGRYAAFGQGAQVVLVVVAVASMVCLIARRGSFETRKVGA